jgi:hypothetical protein
MSNCLGMKLRASVRIFSEVNFIHLVPRFFSLGIIINLFYCAVQNTVSCTRAFSSSAREVIYHCGSHRQCLPCVTSQFLMLLKSSNMEPIEL